MYISKAALLHSWFNLEKKKKKHTYVRIAQFKKRDIRSPTRVYILTWEGEGEYNWI